VYTIVLIDGKVNLSEKFSVIEDVEKFELVKSAATIEFIYIHRLELGISRRVIQLEGGEVGNASKLIPTTRTTFDWLSCRKNSQPDQHLIFCAFGSTGSEIFWGNYDANKEEVSID